MSIASYIVATHFRPRLLEACLARIMSSPVPDGWELEVVVAANPDDSRGRLVAEAAGAKVVIVDSPNVGGKLTAAYKASRGSLVFVSGDDDMHSPARLAEAIRLHTEGAPIVGLRRFRFLELDTGKVAMWDGPTAKVGAGRSFRRHVLDSMHGWLDIPKGVDTDLAVRMEICGLYPHEVAMSEQISLDTICTQHGSNIWQDRVFPDKGVAVPHGHFTITGEGPFWEAPGFPEDVVQLLELEAPAMPAPTPPAADETPVQATPMPPADEEDDGRGVDSAGYPSPGRQG